MLYQGKPGQLAFPSRLGVIYVQVMHESRHSVSTEIYDLNQRMVTYRHYRQRWSFVSLRRRRDKIQGLSGVKIIFGRKEHDGRTMIGFDGCDLNPACIWNSRGNVHW
jgi:hypothetical protein